MAIVDVSASPHLTDEALAHIHAQADEAARHLTYRDAAVILVDVPGCRVEIDMIRGVPETMIGYHGGPSDPSLPSSTMLRCAAPGTGPGTWWDPLDAAAELPVETLGRRARVLRAFYTRFAATFGAEMRRPDLGDVTPDGDHDAEVHQITDARSLADDSPF